MGGKCFAFFLVMVVPGNEGQESILPLMEYLYFPGA